MSDRCGERFSSDVCSHLNVINNWEDECVCTDCGLVLIEQLYSPQRWLQDATKKQLCGMHSYIQDIGENACIAGNVIAYSQNYYDKIKTKLIRKFQDKAIAAFALYESLNKFEVPRLAEEITHFTGIPSHVFLKLENALPQEISMLNPKHFVHRFCNLIDLSYRDQLQIGYAVDIINNEIPLGNVRCNCLVGVVMYLFCKENEKKKTLKTICETCCISATSIHRVIRQLREFSPQMKKISQLSWMLKHIEKIV